MKRSYIEGTIVGICLVILLGALIARTLITTRASTGLHSAYELVPKVTVRIDGGQAQELTLPATLDGLEEGTIVEESFLVPSDSTIFFTPRHSIVQVYVNDRLIYTYGREGTWPSFFTDPPSGAVALSLPESEERLEVRLVYTSPASRSTLNLQNIVTGIGDGINHYMFNTYGTSLLLSVFLILGGLALGFASFFFLSSRRHASLLLWPALMAVCAGLWKFTANTLAIYLVGAPSVMSILSYTAMFALPLPLILFIQQYSDSPDSRLLGALRHALETFLLLALILQLTGLVQLTQSLYVFHALLPVIIVVIVIHLIGRIRSGHSRSKYLLASCAVLAVSVLLELIDYYMAYMSGDLISPFFQIGFMIFSVFILVSTCIHLRYLLQANARNAQLRQEMLILERSIAVQDERSQMIATYQKQLAHQRHDLRHHLRTIRQLVSGGDNARALSYIDEVAGAIPQTPVTSYCDNAALSALLTYYTARAKILGIRLTMNVQVPAASSQISDANLCVLFGNLIENAGEACKRMTTGEKFIHLTAQEHGGMLFIAMDNSFTGQYAKSDGQFLSSKRGEMGTGLQSVRALAAQHGGKAEFTPMGQVFRSEVYVRI